MDDLTSRAQQDRPAAGLAGAPPDLLGRIRAAVRRPSGTDDRLRTIVRILSEGVAKYTWTGVYLLQGDRLVLHNQVGPATPHETIPIGEGICGLAARQGKTVLVPDVGRNPSYLACSHTTRSEIVVPILKEGRVIGEIDVDSDRLDAFDDG
ncbi:MAG TPA: GAF domain-containing protein, partial [Candidatus Polarisedimenticolia bacterium]|nr:GAF domain-containing protein [Candidatus Polarisedimenticolia bacterium]